jgi:hypothetical protein
MALGLGVNIFQMPRPGPAGSGWWSTASALCSAPSHPGAWYFAPGLFLIGVGVGVMLTPSVSVGQSAFSPRTGAPAV